ncbi:MAG: 1-acylglycerol-3-phosphate O-acyltransferase [Sclerophora amabilis]|nr:MAG: 1-acylglycerol-3-phosphate O-acyltransferase [Sclerophora amabilis]
MSSVFTYLLYFLYACIGVTMSLFVLSPIVPRFSFYARLLASHLALLVCAAYGLVASIVLRAVGYGRVSQWATARCFRLVMRLCTGVEVEVQGKEHLKTRPAVFIANHQSELDVLVLGATFPPYCSVTAKKSLKKVPFLGWFSVLSLDPTLEIHADSWSPVALSRTVFIDRSNRENAMAAFADAASEMREEKQSVYIFPEGTRSYYAQPDLLPFKKGAFHLAIQAKVPIVPVVVANYASVLHVPSSIFRSGTLYVKGKNCPGLRVSAVLTRNFAVLPPIPTANFSASDVDHLTKSTRDLMLKELVEFSNTTPAVGLDSSLKSSQAVDGVIKSTGVEFGRRHVDGQVAPTT